MDTSFKLQRLRRSICQRGQEIHFSQIESQKVASVHADGDGEHYDGDDDDDGESNVSVDDGEDDFGIVILLHRSVEELVIRINQCFRYSNVPV